MNEADRRGAFANSGHASFDGSAANISRSENQADSSRAKKAGPHQVTECDLV